MCGIAGFVSNAGPAEEFRELVLRMCDLIRHRGPDGSGVQIAGNAVLGHRRLSIIDLSGGAQPMGNESGSLWLVFNGEIYNFRELRSELESKGYRFSTRSDTEVILHGYDAWGTAVVDRLNGMFAFALWDMPRRRLFAARDRLGKKPFYYHSGKRGFSFASELKSLLADPDLPREVDPESVDNFFSFGYIPAPGTIFKGVQKLRPGHYLTWQDGRTEVRRYWDVRYEPNSVCKTENDYVDRLEDLLTGAVKRRLISDVPLGAFLSGGLDSSTIVGLVNKVSGRGTRTFTIGFEEQGFSELADARAVAGHLGTSHREFTVKSDAIKMMPELVWHFDEPFADSSALPTWYVSQMARSEVTVVLSGDGGDELFAGYNSYGIRNRMLRYGFIPKPVREHLIGPLGRAMPISWPGKSLLAGIGQLEKYRRGEVAELYPLIKRNIFSKDFRGRLRDHDPEHEFGYWDNAPDGPLLSRLQYFDTKIYLPEDILTKVDRMSMANSLETRAPLLDYEVVEFAASIPPDLQRKDGKGKYILRKLAARMLPKAVLEKRKQGFAIPRERWLANEMRGYAEDILTSRSFRTREWFDPAAVASIVSSHGVRRDLSGWIWCLLNFELWCRTFLDAETRRI